MAGILVLAGRAVGWERATQPLAGEPKMQLSMGDETEDRHDAQLYVLHDFGKTLTATQEGKLFSLPFFSSYYMIKSQMSDTARHPKSAHCINISHRWQLCIKTTCS